MKTSINVNKNLQDNEFSAFDKLIVKILEKHCNKNRYNLQISKISDKILPK